MTFRFLSALRTLETDRSIDQDHLTTALKLSLPCNSTILESKERTGNVKHGCNQSKLKSAIKEIDEGRVLCRVVGPTNETSFSHLEKRIEKYLHTLGTYAQRMYLPSTNFRRTQVHIFNAFVYIWKECS